MTRSILVGLLTLSFCGLPPSAAAAQDPDPPSTAAPSTAAGGTPEASEVTPEAAPESPPVRSRGRRQPNEMVPDETAQFAFLIGEWHCTTRSLRPDRSGFVEGEGQWIGYYILDGWAIQDDWSSPAPGGQIFHGTNIRSFNTRTGSWDNRWLAAGNLQWKYYEASRQGETMVMIGGGGEDANGEFVDRNTFYEITEDSWRWRKDRSYDGGESWFEGVAFIEARRAGTAAASAPAAAPAPPASSPPSRR